MDITQAVTAWREGLLSESEILTYLLDFQAEVILSLKAKETAIADQRIVCIYGKAES